MNAATSYAEAEMRLPHDGGVVARDYQQLAKRIEALGDGEWCGESGGLVSGYPFFVLRRETSPDAPAILLTAGMHGDEPAGVEAALQWMEGDAWRSWPVNWLVLPCMNPYGWIHDKRRNADGQDINRHFRPPCEFRPTWRCCRRLSGLQRCSRSRSPNQRYGPRSTDHLPV